MKCDLCAGQHAELQSVDGRGGGRWDVGTVMHPEQKGHIVRNALFGGFSAKGPSRNGFTLT